MVENDKMASIGMKKILAALYWHTLRILLEKAVDLRHAIENDFLQECRRGCENCYRWRCRSRGNAGPYKKIRR